MEAAGAATAAAAAGADPEQLPPLLRAALDEAALQDNPERVAAWLQWLAAWRVKLKEEGLEEAERQALQKSVNPKFIPRQHLMQVRGGWVGGGNG